MYYEGRRARRNPRRQGVRRDTKRPGVRRDPKRQGVRRDPKRQGGRRDPKQQRPAKSQRGILERESMQYDVVIVGAGPAGLAAAIRLRQLSAESGKEITVCVLEKGSAVGAHILSGAVLEPRAQIGRAHV